jgi:hypothetical protein
MRLGLALLSRFCLLVPQVLLWSAAPHHHSLNFPKMKSILLLLAGLGISMICKAQYVYTIKADSVKITNSCDTAEFILENHTMNVPGFLFNTGNGRTVFLRGLQKIDDTTYIIGLDTLKIAVNGVDTIRVLYGGLGITPGYIGGHDTLVLKTVRGSTGISVSTLVDSSLLIAGDTTLLSTLGHLYKVTDSLGVLISAAGSGSVTQVVSGYGLNGGPITSTGTLQVDTIAMSTTALLRKVADSAASAAKPPSGFNVEFVYGSGGSGLPVKNSDSTYTNPGLIGNNVEVFLNGNSTSMMIADSLTWKLTGSNFLTPYFRYNKSLGQLTFCNFGNVSGLTNSGFVVSIFGGPQGYPGLVDTGGGTLSPPIVNAGGSQTITQPASTATLVGSASSPNPGGSIASYLWAYVSGPQTPSLTTPTSVATAVTGMDSLGTYLFSLTATDNGGRQSTAETEVIVTNGESISYTPSSLSGLSTNQGWQSAGSAFFVSGMHLGTNNVTVTAPTNFLVSSDSATWSTSVTLSPTSGTLFSTKLYLAISSSASTGSLSGFVIMAATGATTQEMPVSGFVTSVPNNVSKYNFSSVSSPVNGWTNLYGNPGGSGGISGTNVTTGWVLTTNGLTGNWQTFSGFYGDGTNNAPLPADSAYSTLFPSDVWHSGDVYNYDVPYSSGNYGFQFTNLPAGNYTIQIIGRIPSTQMFNNGGPMVFHMQFGTGSDQSATLPVQNNISGYVTFTGTITSGQIIQFGAFQDAFDGGALGWITALIITKN